MLIGTGRQVYRDDHAFTRQSDLPCHTIELTYSGGMLRRTGDGDPFRLQPNHTLLLTPPSTPYALRGKESGEEIWLIFDLPPKLRACVDWPLGELGIPELPIPRGPLGRDVIRAIEDVHRYFADMRPRREQLAENALERLLLLAGRLCEETNTPFDERVRRSVDLIHARFAEPLSVAAIASAVGLSPSRFAHLFRQETGVTPVSYVEEVRLEQAQLLLLRTDMPIKQIAPLVGFVDPYYFSTRFRRRFGRPPTEWRRGPTFPALSPSTVSSTIVWR